MNECMCSYRGWEEERWRDESGEGRRGESEMEQCVLGRVPEFMDGPYRNLPPCDIPDGIPAWPDSSYSCFHCLSISFRYKHGKGSLLKKKPWKGR